MDTLAPVLATPSLGALRTMLASLGPRSSRADGIRAAEALIAAGIEISDDEGGYLDTCDIIAKVDGPDFETGWHPFVEGYWQAAENHLYPEDFTHEGEYEGAKFYWQVYDGISRAVECHQYRDMPAIPHEMRAAE